VRNKAWVVAAIAVLAAVLLALTLRFGREVPAPEVAGLESEAEAPEVVAGVTGGAAGGEAGGEGKPRPKEEASFDVVRVTPDGGAVIAGRTLPGAEVTVRAGDQVLGKVTADARGEWVLVPVARLKSGAVELSQEVQAPGEAAPSRSEQVVVIVVPEHDEPVLVVRSGGSGETEVLQGPGAEAAAAATGGLSLSAVDYDEEGNVVLSGVAAPGASVRVYVDDRVVGTARADQAGRWRLEPTVQVAPGAHGLRLDQIDEGGQVALRIEVPFSRAVPGAVAVAAGSIVVQPGNSLWRIARAVYGRGTRYTVIYQANREAIRDPDQIYPGQVFALPEAE
jgi:nucleoid-associated protein YgaU